MAELPDLDRPDIFCWGLTFGQFLQLGICGVVDVLPVVGLWVAHLRSRPVLLPVLAVVVVLGWLEFLTIRGRRGGEPLVTLARRGWRFYQAPRRYMVGAHPVPGRLAETPLRLFARAKHRRGLEGEALAPLSLPWKGMSGDDVELEDGTLVRTLAVSGLDVALASDLERSILAVTWTRMLDARDSSVQVLARCERMDLSRRVSEIDGLVGESGRGKLARAHVAQLEEYQGGIVRRLFVCLTAPDARSLDAAEIDFAEEVTAMRLRAERVVGDRRPWWSGEGADQLLPDPVQMIDAPDRLEMR